MKNNHHNRNKIVFFIIDLEACRCLKTRITKPHPKMRFDYRISYSCLCLTLGFRLVVVIGFLFAEYD